MPSIPRFCHRMPAALIAGLAAAHAGAQSAPAGRAVMDPVPGVQVSYERLGSDDTAAPPGRFDGSIATPAGTLRTTVRAAPNDDRSFQRGDTSFDLSNGVLGGKLQLRGLETGGTAADWRAPLGQGFEAKTESERTPVRTEQGLQLQQVFDGGSAQALVSKSRASTGQGSRWDLELARVTGPSRWTAGVEAAERSYVSSTGGFEARTGLRLGTQWPLLPQSKMEVRYTRQIRWDTEEPVHSVMVGTRFQLPMRASLATAVEADTEARRKASLTLTVPLEAR
jgi:hypothetical protein